MVKCLATFRRIIVISKRRKRHIQQGITPQKTRILSNTAVRTSNLASVIQPVFQVSIPIRICKPTCYMTFRQQPPKYLMHETCNGRAVSSVNRTIMRRAVNNLPSTATDRQTSRKIHYFKQLLHYRSHVNTVERRVKDEI